MADVGFDRYGNPKTTKKTQPYETGVGTYKTTPTNVSVPTSRAAATGTTDKKTTTTKSPNFSQETLDLQKKLKAQGYDPGPLDGIMGPKTMNALNASQFAPLPKTDVQKTNPTTPQANTVAPTSAAMPTTNGIVVLSGGGGGFESAEPDTSMQDYIDDLNEAKRRNRIAALDTARENSLANLDEEESGISPRYYNARNEVAGQSDVGAMNFAQFMAARGIKGSAGAMPEIYRNNALQANTGRLNAQEQAERDTIARNRTGIQNNYESDVAAANADIDAQGLQAYINQMNADRAFALQEAATTGTYNGQPTVQSRQYNDTLQRQNRQDYQDTVTRFYDNYQAEVDRVKKDSDPDNDWQIPILEAARQAKISDMNTAAANSSEADWNRAMELWQAQGVADEFVSQVIGIPVGTRTSARAIADANAARSNTSSKPDTYNLDDWGKILDNEFLPKYDSDGVKVLPGITDNTERERRILSLGLDQTLTAELYKRYGIPIPQ
jgi:hypothetical protein